MTSRLLKSQKITKTNLIKSKTFQAVGLVQQNYETEKKKTLSAGNGTLKSYIVSHQLDSLISMESSIQKFQIKRYCTHYNIYILKTVTEIRHYKMVYFAYIFTCCLTLSIQFTLNLFFFNS